MSVWPLRQSSLHARSFRLLGGRHESASLFPLFDDSGTTRSLMVTAEGHGSILLVGHHARLCVRRLLRAPRLALHHTDRSDNGSAATPTVSPDRLAELWHFDPWWELDHPRYAGHPWVPKLKATNIAGFEDRWTDVWFDRRLAHLHAIQIGAGDTPNVVRFEPGLLAAARRKRARQPTVSEAAPAMRSEWRLRPFWHRSG